MSGADEHQAKLKLAMDRERARQARAKEDARAVKVRRWLSQGGQRAIRSGATAEVFTQRGPKLERESPAGERTQVSHLLDPRFLLSDRQRTTGSCYGHMCEASALGSGPEFMRPFVDTTPSGGGGATAHRVHMMRMVEVARQAAAGLPAIVYPLQRSRGCGYVGWHRPVSPLLLLESICVRGVSLSFVGIEHRWVVERMGGKFQGKVEVPGRQRAYLGEALRCVLDAVHDAWEAKGYSIPYEFTRLVVK